MRLRENNYNSIENIKKRLADGAQPHPISHAVLITEIDRLKKEIVLLGELLRETWAGVAPAPPPQPTTTRKEGGRPA